MKLLIILLAVAGAAHAAPLPVTLESEFAVSMENDKPDYTIAEPGDVTAYRWYLETLEEVNSVGAVVNTIDLTTMFQSGTPAVLNTMSELSGKTVIMAEMTRMMGGATYEFAYIINRGDDFDLDYTGVEKIRVWKDVVGTRLRISNYFSPFDPARRKNRIRITAKIVSGVMPAHQFLHRASDTLVYAFGSDPGDLDTVLAEMPVSPEKISEISNADIGVKSFKRHSTNFIEFTSDNGPSASTNRKVAVKYKAALTARCDNFTTVAGPPVDMTVTPLARDFDVTNLNTVTTVTATYMLPWFAHNLEYHWTGGEGDALASKNSKLENAIIIGVIILFALLTFGIALALEGVISNEAKKYGVDWKKEKKAKKNKDKEETEALLDEE